MADVLTYALGVPIAVAAAVLYFCVFMVVLGWPLLVISAVRSLRTIAREMQRANDYREHYEQGVRPGPLGT